jgi:hypothetical protein
MDLDFVKITTEANKKVRSSPRAIYDSWCNGVPHDSTVEQLFIYNPDFLLVALWAWMFLGCYIRFCKSMVPWYLSRLYLLSDHQHECRK